MKPPPNESQDYPPKDATVVDPDKLAERKKEMAEAAAARAEQETKAEL